MTERKKGKRRRRRSPQRSTVTAPTAPPPAAARRTRRALASRLAVLALAAAAFAASSWFFVLYPAEGGPGQGRAVQIVVPPDLAAGALAALLADQGLISRPRLFAAWLRATGGARRVVPGPHLLTDDASPRELMARLERRSGGGT